MQDYILAHTERINKFKLAHWNLVQWDQAGLGVQLYIPDNGEVEPYGSEDPDEVGSLGWVHDWCIRPVGVKGFYKYNLQRRKELSKHTRRKKLAILYTIEDADNYAYCPKYYRESTYRPWGQYVKNFIETKRVEREFWNSLGLSPGPTDYPTDQEVIAILLQVSQFTCETSPIVKPSFQEILALNL
jgi:hypothetical protein